MLKKFDINMNSGYPLLNLKGQKERQEGKKKTGKDEGKRYQHTSSFHTQMILIAA